MGLEAGSAAAAVVTGEDVGGLSLVERVCLAAFHDAADEAVRPVGGLQILVILSGVGEFVRVSKTHIEHLGMRFLQGFQGEGGRNEVCPFPSAEARQVLVNLLQERAHGSFYIERLMGAAARETAALVVHGKADGLPGGEHHHAALVARVCVDGLQHAVVGIGNGVVAVNSLVVRITAEHFAVSGVGEVLVVGHLHEAVLFPVAKKITMLRHMAPDKGHQGFPAGLGRIAPIGRLQGFGIFDKAGVSHQALIGPGKELLPAQAVEGDDNQTGIVVPLGAGNQSEQSGRGGQEELLHDQGY